MPALSRRLSNKLRKKSLEKLFRKERGTGYFNKLLAFGPQSTILRPPGYQSSTHGANQPRILTLQRDLFFWLQLFNTCHTTQHNIRGGGRPWSRVHDVTNTSTRSQNLTWTETMLQLSSTNSEHSTSSSWNALYEANPGSTSSIHGWAI